MAEIFCSAVIGQGCEKDTGILFPFYKLSTVLLEELLREWAAVPSVAGFSFPLGLGHLSVISLGPYKGKTQRKWPLESALHMH